mgnify:CR=1 FL=1
MFLGILGTAAVAFYTYQSGLIVSLLENNAFTTLLIVELIVVLLFSFLFRKLSYQIVALLYFIYAMINGLTFSTLFATFELNSIVYVFVAASVIFAIFAWIGAKTDKDLSNWSTLLMPVLIVGIILSLLNLFVFRSSMLDIILDWVILFLFFGLTIYDVNKLKQLQGEEYANDEKLYIYFAMELYLDFINIFIRLLSIFGRSRD